MAFWFLRGLRKGIVTTRYPRAIDPWTQALPTPPAFRSDRLTSELANKLVESCPPQAMAREAGQLVVDLGACTACGRCLEVGGDALERSGVFELSSWRREQLIKRIPIRGARR
jgi:hypothetical protein